MTPDSSDGLPQYLNPTQIAELLEVSRKTVHLWIKEDKIPWWRVPGGPHRIPVAGLLARLEGNYDFVSELGTRITALSGRLERLAEAPGDDPAGE